MGACVSYCCGDETDNENQGSAQANTLADSQQLLDECVFPAQYSLGQKYSQFPPNPRPCTSVRASVHNCELQKIAIPWRTPVPLTAAQLTRRREEFWETAPAYGGAVEVWQALRNAVTVGQADMETAKMILDCVGVTTPTGTLTEAYDERGYRYSIPPYCLATPANGLVDGQEAKDETCNLPSLPKGLPTKNINIRLSTGDDVAFEVPDFPDVCIGHLREIVRKQLNTDQRIEFFWSGHGPLFSTTKMSAIRATDTTATQPILQAWIFSNNK
ncbi:Ubiquitin domain-containing protein 1-like protein [Paramicrosporidium saccamoebae]|uniref:Ubiquitin domain-containing protein 1-like protein n=1 Tax=Paramicrosporidium saccamoebae TaxID=1246581 RepID=A0A2H9TME6_9FUNG|nr:Ubiquitin domain-containing protein 1-like protein [Paramicrosporidium saccamoebae]